MSADRTALARDFWQLPPSPQSDWKAKYEALEKLISMNDSPARRDRMRDIARSWPGALREAELVDPERLRQRAKDCALCAIESTPRARIAEQGGAGWLLASELNDYLLNYAQMRRWARSHGDSWNLGLARGALCPQLAATWPPAGSVPGLETRPPATRLANLALAWTSGLSLPRLHRIVLDRSGHWDRREGDPDWAHQDGPAQLQPGLRLDDLR